MHDAMKELLPGAMFIGFTGTPLLKADKTTSIETFGSFIHTYKFDEAVEDGVVLDLRYEARNIDQHLTSPAQVDKWFEAKTKGMTDLSKAELKKRWGTMQKVVSAEPRAQADRQRHPAGHGDQAAPDGRPRQRHAGRAPASTRPASSTSCSARPASRASAPSSPATSRSAGDISKEDSGEGATEKLRQYEIYRQMLADHFDEPADTAMNKVEQFEKEVKKQFVNEPGQMRLLIVVDKLLTGFDAPPATYLYIDKKMRDHGLFQAICRVNRLDGDDKDYGYIVDYRDLFNSLRERHHRLHQRRARRLREGGHRGPAVGPAREGPRGPRRGAGDDPGPLRAGRAAARTRSSTSSTSAPPSRATPSSSRPTSRSASSCTRPWPP